MGRGCTNLSGGLPRWLLALAVLTLRGKQGHFWEVEFPMSERKRTRAAAKLEPLAAPLPSKAPSVDPRTQRKPSAKTPTLSQRPHPAAKPVKSVLRPAAAPAPPPVSSAAGCCKSIKNTCSACGAVVCTNCDGSFACTTCKTTLCDACGNSCSFCGNFYCKDSRDDTCSGPLRIFECSACGEYICEDCGALEPCGECGDCFCSDCADLNPGKGGIKKCASCQPWWQKNKPAGAFCSRCGSQRQDVALCNACGERSCVACQNFHCEDCGGMCCETCAEDEAHHCDSCGGLYCSDCVGACGCDASDDEGESES